MADTDHLERARNAFSEVNVSDALKARAIENLARWLGEATFQDARPQLEYLIETENFNALFDAFFQEIPFGTGGRRGPVGFGTNRINPFTVATSIEGHSSFLRRRFPDRKEISVVVAFDVRVFNDLRGVYVRDRPNPLLGMTSRDFAKIAASVYAANRIHVWMPDPGEDRYISTPELSFAIRYQTAQGGLNISASHNHPDDNGAKIYNEKGSQEIPPVDEELAKIVEATTGARSIEFEEAVLKGLVRWLPPQVSTEYLEVNARVSKNRGARSARVVFTPLHGTGFHSAGRALLGAGFRVDQYPEQSKPDGLFPNVPFRSPNPEVRESLSGARDYAVAHNADLVLGTDPDADRIGMLAPHEGEWVFLTGNEIGAVLTHYLLAREGGRNTGGRRGFAITTMVTTSLFSRIARGFGVEVINDLGVGFKYIADVMNTIESTGQYRHIRGRLEDFVIGIEESHGYLVIPWIRDKDAAGAAVLLAEIASVLKDKDKSFSGYLDDIYREFGYVKNLLTSTVMLGARGFLNIRKIQDSLRERPPAVVGDRKVIEVIDRWQEIEPLGKIKSETDRMSRDVLTFYFDGDARVILRPSGTESKNKLYLEVCGKPLGSSASKETLLEEKKRVDESARELSRAFTKEMLSRIDVKLPDHALDISDLVALENKQDFADRFLPELLERLRLGERGLDLEKWIDARLRPYGADARLLVASAVHSYVKSHAISPAISGWLLEAFPKRA